MKYKLLMKTLNKIILLVILLMANSTLLFADANQTSTTVIGNGIGIGSALAIAICWTRTNSVLTSILAGIFGWLYVIYYLIIRENDNSIK
jgi:hypothetical protein